MSKKNNTIPQTKISSQYSASAKPLEIVEKAKDGYIINAETDVSSFPAEPFNTFSSFIFLFLVIYWIRKTKFRIKLYPVIVITMPLLFLAFIGGTMHHALRSEKVWHHLDMICIFYAVMMVCVFFWYRITGSWFKSFFCVITIPLIFRFFLASISLPEKISVSVVFVVMALVILIPAMIHCCMNHLKNITLLCVASMLFVIALFFRETDRSVAEVFPHGTHFLWHIFACIAVFFLIQYLFLTDKDKNMELFKQLASEFKS